MPTDPEKASNEVLYLTGYGSFSDVIASDADHTSAIYRRFDKLAARDLLYYQSELADLQAKQDQYDKEDADNVATLSSSEWADIRRNAQNWAALKQNAQSDSSDGRWRKRMDLAVEIRRTLKEYREALLLDSQLRALGGPDKQSMKAISNTFRNSGYSVLSGPSSNLYPDPSSRSCPQDNDYAAIRKQPEPDLLTASLKKVWPSLFGRRHHVRSGVLMHAAQPQMSYFSIEMLNLTARLICTLLAATLLIAPMISLYYVSKQKPGTTIGLIVVFTLLFAGTVALVTSAKGGDIFAATAAYAAVLVVFAGSTDQSSILFDVDSTARKPGGKE